MRVIKPLQLSLQYKCFSWQKKNQLALTLLLGFPFDDRQEVLLEQDLWQLLPGQLGKDGILDMCMPKPQGEVLVYGSYYAPGGKPVTVDEARLEIGAIDKNLLVIGNRYWRTLMAPTDPEPFEELPISYEYAFGGKDHKANPTGKGLDQVDVFGELRLPLPNIEDPDKLLTSTNQRPDPAGLGPLDLMWEQRAEKTGTYDENWQRDHFPGYPPDLDWTHFNTAPQDQWIDEFWQGGERFQLTNLHPHKPLVSGRLPEFRTRCFVVRPTDPGSSFSEVGMRAETVCLFPSVETGVMIYRGVIEVSEDDAADVEHLLVAYEDPDQSPRSIDYYDEALRNRLDEARVFKYLMYTGDIIPESERCGFARMMDTVGQDGESELVKNMEAKAEAEKQEAMDMLEQQKQRLRGNLEAANIDPAPYMDKFEVKNGLPDDPHMRAIMETLEKLLPGSTSGDGRDVKIGEVDFSKADELTRQMETMAEAKKEDARQQLKDAIKNAEGTESGQQIQKQLEAALEKIDEPPDLPRPRTEETLQNLRDQFRKVEDARESMRAQGVSEDKLPVIDFDLEEVERKLIAGSESIKETYRTGAHYIEGKPPHAEPMDIIQYRFQKLLDKGEPLAGRDLAGVDLSGLDLAGRDLSDCFLEYANLSATNLRGAKLRRAVVTHANLRNADLTGADLRDSNLGDSVLHDADFTGAMLQNSELSKADLKGARFVDCDFEDVNFLESKMIGVEMSGSRFKTATFLNLDLSGGKFAGCRMQECNFLQSTLESTDFSNADLSGSNFVECKLDNSKFNEATMTNTRFPAGCSLRDCNFDKARLDKVNMRDAEAEGSSFEFATFHQADFSGANMQNTRFYGAAGKRAILAKTDLGGADFSSVNLMEGSLMKARLTNADLRHSNLYAVEFMNATVGKTDFEGANLDLTKLEYWRPGNDR